jgi:hypothetical protein
VLHNVKAQVALMDPDPRTDALRELFTALMRFDEVNAYLSTMITGVGVVYPVGGRADDPLAGRMVPSLPLKTAEGTTTLAELLHDARPLLLDLSGDAALRTVAGPWADRVAVVAATPVSGTWDTDAVLVRPDGYAVWSGRGDHRDAESLRTALTRWFGPAGW